MKALIIGAGEVGSFLSQTLSEDGHDVVVIEQDPILCQEINETQNVKTIEGNGSSAKTLAEADVANCDFVLAVTHDDRVNMMACSIAKVLGSKTTIARAHDQTYADTSFINYQLHFNIDYLISAEALCAIELAKLIRNPQRISVESFGRGDIEVQQVRVNASSRHVNMSLKDIRLDRDVRIAYIIRENKLTIPTADTVLEAEDLVTIVGTSKSLVHVKEEINPDTARKKVRIVIFSGTETAIALVRLLQSSHFKIRIIEKDPHLCERLAEQFPHVTIIHGDATSLRLLEEEQVEDCDFFVACSKDDEDNIMTALQAIHLGAKNTQLIINRPDYEHILNRLKKTVGLNLAISPRKAMGQEVLRYMSTKPYHELATLPDKTGKIIEIRVSGTSPCINKQIRELPLPTATVIVALFHKFQTKVPGADDTILAGDRLVIVTRREKIEELVNLFA
ncbi:MAG: Trk system potassium transporter TrkA [Opitutales bacterium]|tara:strand:- start:1148 stop:2497 length:1350 start_codon:yes stop_codon:yes gene_type:complete